MTDTEQDLTQQIDSLTEQVEELQLAVAQMGETIMFFINQQNRIMEGYTSNVKIN